MSGSGAGERPARKLLSILEPVQGFSQFPKCDFTGVFGRGLMMVMVVLQSEDHR